MFPAIDTNLADLEAVQRQLSCQHAYQDGILGIQCGLCQETWSIRLNPDWHLVGRSLCRWSPGDPRSFRRSDEPVDVLLFSPELPIEVKSHLLVEFRKQRGASRGN